MVGREGFETPQIIFSIPSTILAVLVSAASRHLHGNVVHRLDDTIIDS